MKCDKCQEELIENSKFCNNCGSKIEVKEKERDLVAMAEEAVKSASVMWFTVGLIKGNCSKDKKTKKWFKDVFEKGMMKNLEFKKKYEYINSEYNKMFPQEKKAK